MTEAEWLRCTDPKRMLDFLRSTASDRKLRLLVCACCRRVWDSLSTAPIGCEAVEAAEAFADGLLDEAERLRIWQAAHHLATSNFEPDLYPESARYHFAVAMAIANVGEYVWDPFTGRAISLMLDIQHPGDRAAIAIWRTEEPIYRNPVDELPFGRRMWERIASFARGFSTLIPSVEYPVSCALIRDIFGNSFRPGELDRDWAQGYGTAARQLAQVIYEERCFSDLPVLADALEEAGCTDEQILDHCREAGAHVRGCWVIDLLLGKT